MSLSNLILPAWTAITVAKSADKKPPETELFNLQKRYRAILMRSEKELPAIPPKPSGKLTKSDAHNLWGASRRMKLPRSGSQKSSAREPKRVRHSAD